MLLSENCFEKEIWTRKWRKCFTTENICSSYQKRNLKGPFPQFSSQKELRPKFNSTNWKRLKIEYRASSELLRSSFPNAQSQNGSKQTPIVKLQSISVIHNSRFCFCKKWPISFNHDRRWYNVFRLPNWIFVIPHFLHRWAHSSVTAHNKMLSHFENQEVAYWTLGLLSFPNFGLHVTAHEH